VRGEDLSTNAKNNISRLWQKASKSVASAAFLLHEAYIYVVHLYAPVCIAWWGFLVLRGVSLFSCDNGFSSDTPFMPDDTPRVGAFFEQLLEVIHQAETDMAVFDLP